MLNRLARTFLLGVLLALMVASTPEARSRPKDEDSITCSLCDLTTCAARPAFGGTICGTCTWQNNATQLLACSEYSATTLCGIPNNPTTVVWCRNGQCALSPITCDVEVVQCAHNYPYECPY